jgi:hypothetical protein
VREAHPAYVAKIKRKKMEKTITIQVHMEPAGEIDGVKLYRVKK